MPSNRRFTADELARREAYDHGAPKDTNFNPAVGKLRREMSSRVTNAPQVKDMTEAAYTSDRVPRRPADE